MSNPVLPDELLLDIFARVPPRWLFYCRILSKGARDLVDSLPVDWQVSLLRSAGVTLATLSYTTDVFMESEESLKAALAHGAPFAEFALFAAACHGDFELADRYPRVTAGQRATYVRTLAAAACYTGRLETLEDEIDPETWTLADPDVPTLPIVTESTVVRACYLRAPHLKQVMDWLAEHVPHPYWERIRLASDGWAVRKTRHDTDYLMRVVGNSLARPSEFVLHAAASVGLTDVLYAHLRLCDGSVSAAAAARGQFRTLLFLRQECKAMGLPCLELAVAAGNAVAAGGEWLSTTVGAHEVVRWFLTAQHGVRVDPQQVYTAAVESGVNMMRLIEEYSASRPTVATLRYCIHSFETLYSQSPAFDYLALKPEFPALVRKMFAEDRYEWMFLPVQALRLMIACLDAKERRHLAIVVLLNSRGYRHTLPALTGFGKSVWDWTDFKVELEKYSQYVYEGHRSLLPWTPTGV